MKTTVDITPTWRSLMPWLIEIAANGESAEGRAAAMDELLKLADIVDRLRNGEVVKIVPRDQGEAAESQLPDDWPVMIDTSTARRADEIDGCY